MMFNMIMESFYKKEFPKLMSTCFQIEKSLIKDPYLFQKYHKNFTFQPFIILQKFTREICYFFKKQPTF